MRREAIPRSFRTTSRVALITNELPQRVGSAAALLDRGHLILFQPTAEEVHRRTAEWFWDQEVFDFIGKHRPLSSPPSTRDYRLGWELKQAALDWQSWLLQKWGLEGPRLLVAQLKADPSFRREADRVRAFIAQGGGCRATYYNLARTLTPLRPLPPLQLTAAPPPDRCTDEQLLKLLRQRFRTLGGD